MCRQFQLKKCIKVEKFDVKNAMHPTNNFLNNYTAC